MAQDLTLFSQSLGKEIRSDLIGNRRISEIIQGEAVGVFTGASGIIAQFCFDLSVRSA